MKSLGSSSKYFEEESHSFSYRPCDLAATADAVDKAANSAILPIDFAPLIIDFAASGFASLVNATAAALSGFYHHLHFEYQEAAVNESYSGEEIQRPAPALIRWHGEQLEHDSSRLRVEEFSHCWQRE